MMRIHWRLPYLPSPIDIRSFNPSNPVKGIVLHELFTLLLLKYKTVYFVAALLSLDLCWYIIRLTKEIVVF